MPPMPRRRRLAPGAWLIHATQKDLGITQDDLKQAGIQVHAQGQPERDKRVLRFERDKADGLEITARTAGNRVVQYRDGLLPLTTIGGWYDNHERPVVTAVLHTSLGEIGLVVDRVLDVVAAHADGDVVVAQGAAEDVLRLAGQRHRGAVAMTVDCNSRYCLLNPYEGARLAVAEAARNLVCSGAVPIGLTAGKVPTLARGAFNPARC